jgi:nitroimidazol reductase NimA-like FMN-containing flavoprotein (pyridoxamine 5'-phosphate oxidase superfamily)
VRRRHFAVLATASASGRPHSAGVSYELAEGHVWVSTYRSSRKARNVAARPEVALTVAVRRIPFFPPASVQIQGRADIVELDDPELLRLAAAGALGKVTGHGELELDGGCFLRIELPTRVPVYALGMSLWALARDPLGADRIAAVDWTI